MGGLRSSLASALSVQGAEDMAEALARQNGMFSMLPISKAQAEQLRSEHSVYLLDSGRINIAGATDANIDQLAKAILSVF
jgi:aspartate/tyrosine/aromatic aminotransferase